MHTSRALGVLIAMALSIVGTSRATKLGFDRHRRRRYRPGSSPDQRDRKPASWVIAETTELPTRFARIVVTDDRGRYLLPDLPKATY